ncbi:hypothetical protein ARMSODRAFT_1028332 [Armillaria solidipes]|nr:hypothetical protein ARMSODRAFT_1028332 [Armillaria solidipes]
MDEPVTPTRDTKVTIHSWNINGDFVAKMICPKFQCLLARYNINFFQETHLRPDQHLTIPLPHNYKILSRVRPTSLTFDDPWGGIAIVISHRIQYQVREEFSGPDFLVIQVGNSLLYCTYLLPESSDWSTSTLTDDPCDCLAASLVRARHAGFNIIILGDLNARTGNRRVSPTHPVRISVDKKVSTQGCWLLQLLKDTDMVLLNGIIPLSPSSARSTSFQGTRRTVIDYAACSWNIYDRVLSMEIKKRMRQYSDHARLVLTVQMDENILKIMRNPCPKKRKAGAPLVLPDETFLDRLLIRTIESAKTEE